MNGKPMEKDFKEQAVNAKYDINAFEEIYLNFFDKVYNIVAARVRNIAEADDITEEIFIKILLRLKEGIDISSSFKAWVYGVTMHTLQDYWRRSYRNKEDFIGDTLFATIRDEKQEPENIFARNEEYAFLFKCLDNLSERERRIIECKYFLDMSAKETATILNISPTNVTIILTRTIKKLRKHFK